MAVLATSISSSDGAGALGVTGSGGLYLDAFTGNVYLRGGATTNQGQLTASLGMSIPDDTKLRFGSATGDVTLRYDESSSDTLLVDGHVTIADDKKLYFGTGKDASIEYDEDGTDLLTFGGANAFFTENVTFGNAATDVTTLASQITASEGIKVSKTAYFANKLSASSLPMPDAFAGVTSASIAVANGDQILVADASAGNAVKKIAVGDLLAQVTASSGGGDITGVTAGVGLSGGGDSGGVTLTLDLSEVVEETGTTGPNPADYVVFTDTSDSNNTKKATVAHFLAASGSSHSGSTGMFHTLMADKVTTFRHVLPNAAASASIFCQNAAGGMPMLVFDTTSGEATGGALIFGDSTGSAGGFVARPAVDNAFDLGSATKRWRNIYTGDLHLANDRGNWTVIEEENYLTLRNNKNGKRFKLVMEELSEGEYGPGNDTN
jgi:hypothetical protein